ncbi:MAG: YciE/YciF ferroxidase family protein [Verrucomicrobiota bacterium]|jgi:ferritin-like metal-binding protein YciE
MSELNELFLDELADILYAEKLLVKTLPKMAKAAEADELREAIEMHLEETQTHVERLEQVFELFGKPVKGKKCEAMEGLVAEGKTIMEEWKGSPALDAGIISAAQKVEHYEIASYGTLATWAELLGNDEAADLLRETLEEEKNTDEKLTELAEQGVNEEAEEEGEEDEEPQSSSRSSSSKSSKSKSNSRARKPAKATSKRR